MKASAFIKELQSIISLEGDLDIGVKYEKVKGMPFCQSPRIFPGEQYGGQKVIYISSETSDFINKT